MTAAAPPRVTVMMPVFNAMPYLREAVRSVLAQSFRDFLLLAVDDGSTDGSVEYLRSVGDPRLRVLADGAHRGMGAALNFALERADTEYVARMDGDDVCPPDRFARQVALLDASPFLGAVGTQFTYMGNAGRTGFARWLPLRHEEICRDLAAGTLAVIHASLMIRTGPLRGIGGYRFDGIGEDWDMFLRLCEVTRFANLPEVGYYYRLHGRNATSVHQRLTQERIRYACRCAETRRAGLREPSFAEFEAELARRPLLSRYAARLDAFSVARYYTGRNYVLNGRPAAGWGHLALGAMASPRRVAGRVGRALAGFGFGGDADAAGGAGRPRAAGPGGRLCASPSEGQGPR